MVTVSDETRKKNVRKSGIAANMHRTASNWARISNYSLVETVFRKRVVVVAGIGK